MPRTVILGAGTAGLAAALFLHRRGEDVTVLERVEHPSSVGAGILLQPTGMLVMQRLGLLHEVLAHGHRVERLYGRTVQGRVVLDLAYADLAPGLFGLGLHRGALFHALWEAARRDGVRIHTGVEVERVTEAADHVRVLGERYDRAIVADGARSHLRPPWASTEPYPWGAFWYVFPTPPGRLEAPVLSQVYRDTRRMLGFLPTGTTPEAPDVPLTSLFWSLRADSVDEVRARGLEAWKAEVRALAPDAPLDSLVDPHQLLFAPYFDVRMRRVHSERMVWIGDSAHAMSPQLGQGANLALWDAMVLAEAPSLAAFAAQRRAHVAFYQWASRGLTPFFQSSLPVLAPARDLFSPLFHRWPWYRRQMLESLAGVKTGLASTLPGVL